MWAMEKRIGKTRHHIDGRVLWANLHLLFWLSLVPFTTAWIGENHVAPMPTALYGLVLLAASIAYMMLQRTIVAVEGPKSALAEAVGTDLKGKVSMGLYALAVPLAFVHSMIAVAIYAGVAAMWLVPDRRIEAMLERT
jgi:uncharacterized membrane protein